jgi:hypothetical protein
MGLDVYEDIENCFAGGWSDGLPVVPPYGTLVDAMLAAMGWPATEIIGSIEEQRIDIRAEHVAAAAVMAGCRTEYGPLLRALSLALVDPAFNLGPVEVTTGGVAALVVVSGPAVSRWGFQHESNALGANTRVNATVGRFAQMVRYFCGRGGGTMHSHGTMGHPGRLGFLVAEHPETTWGPFHTQFGIDAGSPVVSVMSAEGPNSVNNHYAETGELVLETIADTLRHFGSTNFYYHSGRYLVVLCPDHVDLIAQEFTRDEARRYLYEHARRPTTELLRVGRIHRSYVDRPQHDIVLDEDRSVVRAENRISFIEAGAPGGKFSAVIPGWVGSYKIVSRVIDEREPGAAGPAADVPAH